jgi:hypothetical protein
VVRIGLIIAFTAAAFVALIILAGRTNWYGISYELTSDAIDAIADDDSAVDGAGATVQPLSDPATWSRDFMRGARSTPDCPTDTVRNVRIRMAAIGPYTVEQFETTIASYESPAENPDDRIPTFHRASALVKRSLTRADGIFVFSLNADSAVAGFARFSGYFVARGECIVHVEVTSYGN